MSIGMIASQAFSPNKIAGLKLWLDAADAGTIVESGGAISQWNDKSSEGNDATQFVGASQPTYVLNGLNSLNIVRFDGSNDFLGYDGTFLAGTDYTVFIVEQRASGKANNFFTAISAGPPSVNTILLLGYLTDIEITHDQLSNGYEIAVPAFTVKIPRIHTFTQNSVAGKKYYQDGSQQGSDANTVPLVSYINASIGSFLGILFYEGDIAEIIMYPSTLSDGERGQIDVYLSNKWGIALA